MDRQEAIELLLEHYQYPHNRGVLADADVVMPGGNPGCDDLVTIYLKIDAANDRIEKLTFEGEGCTISQAASSILTGMVQDAPLSQVDELDFNDMIEELGYGVVSTRPRCATLALGTLKAAVAKYRNDKLKAQLAADQPGPTEPSG